MDGEAKKENQRERQTSLGPAPAAQAAVELAPRSGFRAGLVLTHVDQLSVLVGCREIAAPHPRHMGPATGRQGTGPGLAGVWMEGSVEEGALSLVCFSFVKGFSLIEAHPPAWFWLPCIITLGLSLF